MYNHDFLFIIRHRNNDISSPVLIMVTAHVFPVSPSNMYSVPRISACMCRITSFKFQLSSKPPGRIQAPFT